MLDGYYTACGALEQQFPNDHSSDNHTGYEKCSGSIIVVSDIYEFGLKSEKI